MESSTSLLTIGEAVEELQEFVQIVHLVKLFSLSSMVLYIYNYLITLDSEFSIMWKASFGYGKAVYFVLRYCTLLSTLLVNLGLYFPQFTPELCTGALFIHQNLTNTHEEFTGGARNIFLWVSAVIIALATDFALQLRVYALYQGSRKIQALLFLSLLAEVTSFATFLTIILRHDKEKMTLLGLGMDHFICEGSTLPPVYDKIWVAKLVNEALMFLLVLNKGVSNVRAYRGTGAGSQLINLLVKDSALYFFVVFAFCLMSQLVWTEAGQHFIELPVGLTLAIGSIMSQQLMVNVRVKVMDKDLSTTVGGTDMQYGRPTRSDYTIGEESIGSRTVCRDV